MSFMNSKTWLAQWTNHIDHCKDLVRNGILVDDATGLEYFTGYSYKRLYDWDQYFEAIILQYLGLPSVYAKNAVVIFLKNQSESGYIPRSIPPTAFPDDCAEHVKPFLAQTALLASRHERDFTWLSEDLFMRMMKYIEYWLFDLDRNGNGLSEWESAPHTGMDTQHERAGYWDAKFGEGVDLNCYLVRECRAFAGIAEELGYPDIAARFNDHANNRAARVQELCWDEEESWFYDIDARTGKKLKVKTAGGFAAMWAGIATDEQAHQMVTKHLLNPKEFWSPYPVAVYARNEPGYSEDWLEGDIGCLWRANTWIPVNYYVYHALRQYGYESIASLLAEETYDLVDKHPEPREYYNSETGEGMGLEPFWGWTLLAYLMPVEELTGIDPTDIDCKLSSYIRISV